LLRSAFDKPSSCAAGHGRAQQDMVVRSTIRLNGKFAKVELMNHIVFVFSEPSLWDLWLKGF